MIRLPLRSTLFPYTTLFRSHPHRLRTPPARSLRSPPGRDARDLRQGRRLGKDPPAVCPRRRQIAGMRRSEEHTSELQSQSNLVCRLLLEKKKYINMSYALYD